jgi:hypothetical protein
MAAQHKQHPRRLPIEDAPSRPGAIASGILEVAGLQASQALGWLKNEGTVFVATRKTEAADELSKFGAAIRDAAEKLNDQSTSASLGRYVTTAADGIEKAARYLERTSMDALIDDASKVARRNPTLFIGGAFIAGLAAARFAKAAGAKSPARHRLAKSQSHGARHG